MYFGQDYAPATEDLELTSLLLEFRAILSELASGDSGASDQVFQRLRSKLLAAKAFFEGFHDAGNSDPAGADMFSLLIAVENPSDWDGFRNVLDSRLKQIDRIGQGTSAVDELKIWADGILNALQERSRSEGLRGRTWWSP